MTSVSDLTRGAGLGNIVGFIHSSKLQVGYGLPI